MGKSVGHIAFDTTARHGLSVRSLRVRALKDSDSRIIIICNYE